MSLSSLLTKHCPKFETTIPSSGERIWYRPILVKEEKKLLTIQEFGTDREINNCVVEILESCFDSDIIRTLPVYDVEYLFIKLRTKSIGYMVEPYLICPHTGENIKLSIDLDTVSVTYNKDHTRHLDLGNRTTLNMKYPTMYTVLQGDDADYLYNLAISCMDTIQAVDEMIECKDQSREELENFLYNMSSSQFKQIIYFFETMPKLEKSVTYTTSDGVERSVVFRGIRDFFR